MPETTFQTPPSVPLPLGGKLQIATQDNSVDAVASRRQKATDALTAARDACQKALDTLGTGDAAEKDALLSDARSMLAFVVGRLNFQMTQGG